MYPCAVMMESCLVVYQAVHLVTSGSRCVRHTGSQGHMHLNILRFCIAYIMAIHSLYIVVVSLVYTAMWQ